MALGLRSTTEVRKGLPLAPGKKRLAITQHTLKDAG